MSSSRTVFYSTFIQIQFLLNIIYICFGKEEEKKDQKIRLKKYFKQLLFIFKKEKQVKMMTSYQLYFIIENSLLIKIQQFKNHNQPKQKNNNKDSHSISQIKAKITIKRSKKVIKLTKISPTDFSQISINYLLIMLSSKYQHLLQSKQLGKYTCKFEKLIGKGSYSQVYLAKGTNSQTYAIKVIKKSTKDTTAYDLALNQAKILAQLDHKNIVKLIGTYQQSNYYYLLLNKIEGQPLSHLIKRKQITTEDAQKIFTNIVLTIKYLNSKNIIHRDIKPQNIIINKNKQIVIIDFGFSCKNDYKNCNNIQETLGTPYYMSPQILDKKQYNSKSDIWSLGVVLYEMIFGKTFFKGQSFTEVQKQMKKFKKDSLLPNKTNISLSLKQILLKCLTIDPKQRIQWNELFAWARSNFYNPSQTLQNTRQPCCFTLF